MNDKITMPEVVTMLEMGNILPIVERHNKYYESKLQADSNRFIQEDTIPTLFRDKLNNSTVSIGFGIICCFASAWIPCEKIRVTPMDGSDAREYLEKILSMLDLKHFRDEDAPGGGINVTVDEDNKEIAECYVNPDFASGFWENHTLYFQD